MNISNDDERDFLSRATPEQIAVFKQMGMITEAQAQRKTKCDEWLDRFITTYDDMIEMKRQVKILSTNNKPVLIIGDTGTGKELLANALHGDRKGRFIAINCASLPETLLESELFGHTKGSFTGAVTSKLGLAELASDGTLFLDEIGDMPLTLQPKLLRAIQEKKIRPLGASEEKPISCRFVAATHMDLESRKSTGQFREDLYWRLSTFLLKPTSLASRSRDIKPLVEELDEECLIKDIDAFVAKINPKLLKGNVRSLQQIIERYIVLGIEPHK